MSRHRDKNGGKSIALSFGDFEGGTLVIDDIEVDSFQKPVIFDGSIEHYVTPHTGNRWSMVIFLHSKAWALDRDSIALLKRVGFNLKLIVAVVSDVEREQFSNSGAFEEGGYARD